MLIWINGLTCYMNNKGTQIDVIVTVKQMMIKHTRTTSAAVR